jgi:hypothetical protein
MRPLLKKCLEKDPERRLRDIGDAWILLEGESPAETPRQRASWLWPSLAAALFLAALTLGFLYLRQRPPAAGAVRFEITPPDKVALGNFSGVSSPQARTVSASLGPILRELRSAASEQYRGGECRSDLVTRQPVHRV